MTEMSQTMVRMILAGYQEHGTLLMGSVLARAGMIAGKQVSWIPSHDPERSADNELGTENDTVNCSVVISDQEIDSAIVDEPDIAIVMNTEAFERFVDSVAPGGILYINSSTIIENPHLPPREDIRVICVPVDEMAEDLGAEHVAKIIMLGAVQAITPIVTDDALALAIREVAKDEPKLADLNAQAFKAGECFGINLEFGVNP